LSRYFDGFGNDVTDEVVKLRVENKRLLMDVRLLEEEVERQKRKVKREKQKLKKVKKQVADAPGLSEDS